MVEAVASMAAALGLVGFTVEEAEDSTADITVGMVGTVGAAAMAGAADGAEVGDIPATVADGDLALASTSEGRGGDMTTRPIHMFPTLTTTRIMRTRTRTRITTLQSAMYRLMGIRRVLRNTLRPTAAFRAMRPYASRAVPFPVPLPPRTR